MAAFIRNVSACWHDEVPGTRWFRADLHVHTLDDHPSSNLTRPRGVSGTATDPQTQTEYARQFLRAAIANGVEVLGLTPHATCSGDGDATSATWRIVEVWNEAVDDDGVPFRDKIYAVFPGFEPSLSDGAEGLHLLFLFDPEIERSNYVAICGDMMNAVPSYDGNSLRVSTQCAEEVFESIEARLLQKEEWRCLCLAPHAFGKRGLYSLKSQLLKLFPSQYISAIQLKDDWLPEDAYADKPWLEEGMATHHAAFFHASDAYRVEDIGRRNTLVKMASPRIESLRQAFLAKDSRVRLAYAKAENGEIGDAPDLPESRPIARPWLHRVSIRGGTSFFGGQDTVTGEPKEQSFSLSPDLTCLIGGRMSGKSTFLDGVRVHFGHELPEESGLRDEVQERARDRFLSGNAEIGITLHGPIPSSVPLREQWPARLFTQRELRGFIDDQDARRHILHRLIPAETESLVERETKLRELDDELLRHYESLAGLRDKLSVAEQSVEEIQCAQQALERFRTAGYDVLELAQADHGKVEGLAQVITEEQNSLSDAKQAMKRLCPPTIADDDAAGILAKNGDDGLWGLLREYGQTIADQHRILTQMLDLATRARALLVKKVGVARANVQAALIQAGGSAEEMNQFDALVTSVAGNERACMVLATARQAYWHALRRFGEAHRAKLALVSEQREAMARVAEMVRVRFSDRIRIKCVRGGLVQPLDEWISSLKTASVTRWWGTVKADGLHPEDLRRNVRIALQQDTDLPGMSPGVSKTFRQLLTPLHRMHLAALRSDDRYMVELAVPTDTGTTYRPLEKLSGGTQLSVLLSLVLETEDAEPLVVDQPEDETDKDYLMNTLIPALHRLKGRRQVIFATHDANMVVNGDADQVIALADASADRGTITAQGAIDDPDVKAEIIRILDGGKEAFALRRAKYKF